MQSQSNHTATSKINLLNADWLHIICYGQSFSVGADAPCQEDPVDGVYLFGSISDSRGGTTLSPLTNIRNQHPILSASNVLARYLAHDNHPTPLILGSYGSGGQSIAQLMSTVRQQQIKKEKGYSYDCNAAGRYEIFASSTHAIANYAHAKHKSIACPAIVFLQGERDYHTDAELGYPANAANAAYAAGGDKDLYKEYMSRLKNDMQNHVMEAYGQKEKPLFLIDQVSGAYVKKNSGINMAQIEFALENEDVILVQSPYFTPHYTNSHHLTTNGYRWLGEYIGRYLFRALTKESKPYPLLPSVFSIDQHNVVRITVAGSQNGLTIDTHTVKDATNTQNIYGFHMVIDGTTVVPTHISTIKNEIVLTLPKHIDLFTANSICIYYAGANANGIGNIRDHCTECGFYEYLDDTHDTGTGKNQGISHHALDENGNSLVGQPYPLYNWLSSFCYEIQ